MRLALAMIFGAMLLTAVPGAAQPYERGWGEPGWDAPYGPYGPEMPGRDPREGKIQAASFAASSPKAAELGHGAILLTPAPESMQGPDVASFEAALVQELGRAGYRTDADQADGGQTIEYVVRHDVIQPPEGPHDPVHGGVSVGAGGGGGWHGSGAGIGLALDFSRPLKALIATRIDARIRDSATHEILWEGHAEVMTRDGDKHWAGQLLATRLTAALFKGFPHPLGG